MDQITYYDRYARETKSEKIYGDKSLRWTYGTLPGKIALAAVVKRAVFSHWYGWLMDRPKTREKIRPFIQEYGLDAEEFELNPNQFGCFNEFFYRKLKPTARPIDPDPNSVVFPADGRHLCVPDLSNCQGLFVKGEMFNLAELLDSEAVAQQFSSGSLLLSRLCPVDYHRFHFPLSGRAGSTQLINGPLYSVNPIALCQNIQIFTTNKRTLTILETEQFGRILLLEIGATCVGGIVQTYRDDCNVAKGDEKGYFRFGGSSTITIFEPGRITFDDDLVHHSAQHCELYARMGDRMATVRGR